MDVKTHVDAWLVKIPKMVLKIEKWKMEKFKMIKSHFKIIPIRNPLNQKKNHATVKNHFVSKNIANALMLLKAAVNSASVKIVKTLAIFSSLEIKKTHKQILLSMEITMAQL